MRAGKMDEIISFKRTSYEVHDEFARVAEAKDWVINREGLRAQIIESSTEEYLRAYGEAPEGVIVFRTRYFHDAATADVIVWGGRAYDIKNIRHIGRRRGLEFRAVARMDSCADGSL